MNNHQLLSPDEVAGRLGVAVSTVLKWIRHGRLKAYRCSRKTIRLDWDEVLRRIHEPHGPRTSLEGANPRSVLSADGT